jgi:hypothetical protein
MLHISQMIDSANSAVTEIKVSQGKCLMAIMSDSDFTQEQKMKLSELLKPIDVAISKAQTSFLYEIQE